jgi:hypothetical protein
MLDAFNLTNSGVVTSARTTVVNYQEVLAILNPRVVRFGVRYDFKTAGARRAGGPLPPVAEGGLWADGLGLRPRINAGAGWNTTRPFFTSGERSERPYRDAIMPGNA